MSIWPMFSLHICDFFVNVTSTCQYEPTPQLGSLEYLIFFSNFLSKDTLICGLEWNVQEDIGQIDITYWHSWYDLDTESWETKDTTLSLLKDEFDDYDEFLNSFTGDGFTLLINLAEGSDWVMGECGCSESDILANGENHYVVVQSAKVYGF